MKALLAIFLFLPAACCAAEWNQHFSISGTPELHIVSGNAAVRVLAGSSSGIDVELKTKGYPIGPSGAHVEARQEGNRLDLQLVQPEMNMSLGEHSIELVVHVPSNVQAYVKSGNGPVELRGLHGTAHLNAANGPVHIQEMDGVLDSETGNGPVHVSGRFDGLQLRMGNGPLTLIVEQSSRLTSGWHVEAGNGPVNIKIPTDIHADLALHTGKGPLALELPIQADTMKGHEMRAKLNGGGPELSIYTGHGPVSIGRT